MSYKNMKVTILTETVVLWNIGKSNLPATNLL